MSETEYQSRSLSQLVRELHSLGDSSIQIVNNTLLSIHQKDDLGIRRFRSKSNPNQNVKSNPQKKLLNTFDGNNRTPEEFFLAGKSEKKYFYHQVLFSFEEHTMDNLLEWINYGYSVNLLTDTKLERLENMIGCLASWAGDCQGIACSFYQYSESQIKNLLTQETFVIKHSDRDLSKNLLEYHNIEIEILAETLRKLCSSKQPSSTIKILRFYTLESNSQLRFIMLPDSFLSLNSKNPTLQLVRKQISQILNYLKLNPSKRYEQINKLITKRHWITNLLNDLFLGQSVNYVVNFVNNSNSDSAKDQALTIGKFQFFDKFLGIKNLVRKSKLIDQQKKNQQISINIKPLDWCTIRKKQAKQSQNQKTSKKNQLQKKNVKKHIINSTEQTKSRLTSELSPVNRVPKSDFQYCRDLQRKTHKYSIVNDNNCQDSLAQLNGEQKKTQFKLTCANNINLIEEPLASTMILQQQSSPKSECSDQKLFQYIVSHEREDQKLNQNNQSETIVILKAQHVREISQYHSTIQNLNRKILILTKERGLEEIFSVHQKEIMMLELKIKQLRNDISILASDNRSESNSKKESERIKDMKAVVKKLNEQVKRSEQKTSLQKVSQGKIKMQQKQLQQWRQKYEESEISRKNLTNQIQALTKRLSITTEIVHPNKNQQKKNSVRIQSLAYRDEQLYNQFVRLLLTLDAKSGVNNEGTKTIEYIERKLLNLLKDLSQTRDTILSCNNFLVQLQSHLEQKLGEKDAEVVLDCNRFIRGFLLGNLSVL